jgi:hypothetical protein
MHDRGDVRDARPGALTSLNQLHNDTGAYLMRAASSQRRERREGEGRKKGLRIPLPVPLPQGDTATG